MPALGVFPVDGGELGFEERGEGPAFVLTHGGLTTGDLWDREVDQFSTDHRVVRYDLRGSGRSPSASGRFAYHEDLRALLDHLRVERAHLLGHSLGGAVTVDFALVHPKRVASLVLVASALDGALPTREEDDALAARWLRPVEEAEEVGDLEAATEANLAAWLAGPYRSLPDLDPRVVDRARTLFRSALASAQGEGIDPVGPQPPPIERLRHLRAPTLVIVGALDFPHVREVSDRLASELPHATLRVVPGAAHFPMLEAPAEFDQAVRGFLNSVDRR